MVPDPLRTSHEDCLPTGIGISWDLFYSNFSDLNFGIEYETALRFLGLVCAGWPLPGAGEHCGLGPIASKTLANFRVYIWSNAHSTHAFPKSEVSAVFTAEEVARLALAAHNPKAATHADRTKYADTALLEYVIRKAYIKKDRDWLIGMLVFGLQTVPLVATGSCVSNRALATHICKQINWDSWFNTAHGLAPADRPDVVDEDRIYNIIKKFQDAVRLGTVYTTTRADAQSYTDTLVVADLTVLQWRTQLKAGRAASPDDVLREAVSSRGLYTAQFIAQTDFSKTLSDILNQTLDDREIFVIKRRLGIGCPRERLAHIGEQLKITREAARQIEVKAIAKLSHPVSLRRTLMPHTLPAPVQVTPPSSEAEPLSVLSLSVRSFNCLRRAGIATVGELRRLSDNELLVIPNLGRTSLVDIKTCLATYAQNVGSCAGATAQPISTTQKSTHRQDLDAPIEELGLSPRPRNCLRRVGVTSIAELAILKDDELLVISGFGETSLQEVRTKLNKYLSPVNTRRMCTKSRCQSLGRCVCVPDA
jgi:hypothetical protein